MRYEVYSGNNQLASGGGGNRVAKGELVVDPRQALTQLKTVILSVRKLVCLRDTPRPSSPGLQGWG